jgi:hypothetical protein
MQTALEQFSAIAEKLKGWGGAFVSPIQGWVYLETIYPQGVALG